MTTSDSDDEEEGVATTQEDQGEIKKDSLRGSLPGSLQHFLSAVGVVNPAHPSSSQSMGTNSNSLAGPLSNSVNRDGLPNNNSNNGTSSPSIFESSLDLTPERLRFVFSIFDTDKDDRIDYESLRKGLDFAGNSVADEESFQKLVESLDLDQSGDISFGEFCEGMRMLMLRDLYRRSPQRDVDIEVMDYNTVKLEHLVVNAPVTQDGSVKSIDAKDFYFQERPNWVQTRWIIVRNSPLAMQHLAVFYSLHPLSLEDALSPHSHRAKAEQYTSHYFIMCPYFTMEYEAILLPPKETPHQRLIYAIPKFIGWCLGGFPNRRHRQQQQNQSGGNQPTTRLSCIRVNMTSIFVKMPKNDTMILHVHALKHSPHLGQRVKKELERSYSKLRQYDAQYLVYALLDEAVDALEPIISRVKQEIQDEREFLLATHYNSLDRIHHLKSELTKVNQKLKPFMRLLTHVIEDDAISPGATIYLRDVLDNLEGFDEEFRHLLNTCASVDDDAEKFQSRQMDKTLYTLTVISAVFLPAQFLTGTLFFVLRIV